MPRLDENHWVTAQGEMADEIASAVYGMRSEGLIELLKANPKIAKLPPVLPANLKLILPRLPNQDAVKEIPIVRIFS